MVDKEGQRLEARVEEVVKGWWWPRVKPKFVVGDDVDFVRGKQGRMEEEFGGCYEEIFDTVHGRRRGEMGGLVSRVDTGSTALANEPCRVLIPTLLAMTCLRACFCRLLDVAIRGVLPSTRGSVVKRPPVVKILPVAVARSPHRLITGMV